MGLLVDWIQLKKKSAWGYVCQQIVHKQKNKKKKDRQKQTNRISKDCGTTTKYVTYIFRVPDR